MLGAQGEIICHSQKQELLRILINVVSKLGAIYLQKKAPKVFSPKLSCPNGTSFLHTLLIVPLTTTPHVTVKGLASLHSYIYIYSQRNNRTGYSERWEMSHPWQHSTSDGAGL